LIFSRTNCFKQPHSSTPLLTSPHTLTIRYKEALHSATSLQQAAKDAAGQLRQQADSFASHKQTIQASIKALREAQLQAAAWGYATKLVLCVRRRCCRRLSFLFSFWLWL